MTVTVETPSGKDAAYENFPVGSWLLPVRLRPHVATFYRFARAIDDIADNPNLAPAEKIARLEGFDRALLGEEEDPAYAKAHAIRLSLAETGVPVRHCRDLIDAFKQDAVKSRYDTWEELIDYCNRSAAPVGRYLVDLHGGSRDGYGPADALCNALQVLNHLQDCQDDYRTLDRVYLPGRWLAEAGARVDDLDRPRANRELKAVIGRCLDGVDRLLGRAAPLPRGLNDRRLALEAAAILEIARALARRLRREDPLAGRVELSKFEFVLCCTTGAGRALFAV